MRRAIVPKPMESKMSKFNVKESAASINAESVSIGKDLKESGKRIQTQLVAIAEHILNSSGDVTVAKKFIAAISPVKNEKAIGIVRVNAVMKWLNDFAAVSYSVKEDSYSLNKKVWKEIFKDVDMSNESDKETRIRGYVKDVSKTAWNAYTPDKNAPGKFSVDAEIARFKESLEKKIKEAMSATGRYEKQTPETREKNVYHSDALEALRTIQIAA